MEEENIKIEVGEQDFQYVNHIYYKYHLGAINRFFQGQACEEKAQETSSQEKDGEK